MSPSIRSIVLALVLGSALLAPAAAQANPNQMSIMMDDDLLVYRNDSTAARALTQMKSLGVDTVRVTVLWQTVAENARFLKADIAKLKGEKYTRARKAARRQNARFKAANPSTYPIRNWDRYDNLVRAATDRGIRVYFNVTGPGPRWAHAKKPKGSTASQRTYKPNAHQYKLFVTAVGKRFDGTYRDENGSRSVLPRVSMWSLWNEPNQGGWLSPQWENGKPASPALYRKLYQSGYAGLVSTGHRADNDIVLLGETAPLGSDAKTGKSPMRPKLFIRELFSGNLGGPLPATGWAHHPYTKNVSPLVRDPNPDSLTMANISELGDLLDQMSAQSGGNIAAGLPLFMTEYGFETNPPDPFSGVSPDLQSKYDTLGDYLAYLNPRIASQAQFLLVDVPPVKGKPKTSKSYWFTYQSGLYYQRGQPKPAAYSYAFPFIATATPTDPVTGQPSAHLWGQLRFQATGVPDSVQIQWKPTDGSADWVTVGDPVPTDPTRGYFEADRTAPIAAPGYWRAIWLDANGAVGLFTGPSDGLS
jgi:hypothetical protein